MTIDDPYALPEDGKRYELLAGRLVCEPVTGAKHGRVVAALVELLRSHVRPRRLGVVFTADAGYILARCPDTLRGPDVSFVSQERFSRVGDVATAFPGPPATGPAISTPRSPTT
jgi:Uma2 family endonuclease